jgi:UDP-galactopyranose mutase
MYCDLICMSHLRWDHVYQRPQHLMVRAVQSRRVLFVEEPVISDDTEPGVALRVTPEGVTVLVPQLPRGTAASVAAPHHAELIRLCAEDLGITRYALWMSTPLARELTTELEPIGVAYDCMDEWPEAVTPSGGISPSEAELLQRADVVFVGGQSLFRARRPLHANLHCLPSAVDVAHFGAARNHTIDPPDLAPLGRPRAGYFGAIDERMDLALLEEVASLRPEIQFIMIGPVVALDPATLPNARNIHWLGRRAYQELPGYIGGWNLAILPFTESAATRYISPAMVPEFLAAGKPVVSTAIRDVVHPYGVEGLVRIARRARAFAEAMDDALVAPRASWLAATDRHLSRMSWDLTWSRMDSELNRVLREREARGRTTKPLAAARSLIRPGGVAIRAPR